MPNTMGHKLEQVADFLRGAINDQRWMPGRRLVEAELTQSLGISRSLLREAFRQVAAEGMIELVPNKGAVVRRMSRKQAIELFQVRIALEMLAARLAAEGMAATGGRKDFEAAVSEIWDDTPRTSSADYIGENRRFHDAIFAATGNSELIRLSEQLQLSVILAQISGALTPETLRASVMEHRSIARAILDGEGERAAELARVHLTRAVGLVQAAPAESFRDETPAMAYSATSADR